MKLPPLSRIEVFLFLSLWLTYGSLMNSDNLQAFNLQQMGVEAMVERGHFYLEGSKVPQLRPLGDTFSYRHHIYAAKQPGQFMAGALAYYPLHSLGLSYLKYYLLSAGLVTFLTVSLTTAAASVALFKFARELTGEPSAKFWPILAALIFGLGSTALPYSGIAHHDALSSNYLVIAAYLIFRLSRGGSSWRAEMLMATSAGVLLGLTVTTSMLPFFMAVGVALYFVALRRWKLFPGFLAGCLIGLAPLLIYDWVSFGNPFLLPNFAGHYSDTYFHLTWFNFSNKVRFYARFITLYAPIVWIGLLGLVCLERKYRRESWLFLGLVLVLLAYILNIDSVGTCLYGPRYLLPAMAFTSIGIAGFSRFRAPLWRWTIAAIVILTGAYSAFVNVVGAMQGAMYCDLDRFALLPYLNAMTSGHMRSFPLSCWMILPTGLVLVAACINAIGQKDVTDPAD